MKSQHLTCFKRPENELLTQVYKRESMLKGGVRLFELLLLMGSSVDSVIDDR